MAVTGGLIERYELKYRLPPALVDPIREVIRRYCDPDDAAESGSYVISSLYLDTRDHRLYRDTIDQVAYRYKLRIRRYVKGPVFLETKRRLKDVISKSRVAVPATAWPGLMVDPAIEHGLDLPEKRQAEVTRFVNRVLRIQARPAAVVRYRREAWVSRIDDYARVTFDHLLEGRTPDGWEVPVADGPGWMPLDVPDRFGLTMSGVVLELKCTTAVPVWMTDIVRQFGLKREGFSKYGAALEAVMGRPAAGRLANWRDAVTGPWAKGAGR